jgi:hypothetical protein
VSSPTEPAGSLVIRRASARRDRFSAESAADDWSTSRRLDCKMRSFK